MQFIYHVISVSDSSLAYQVCLARNRLAETDCLDGARLYTKSIMGMMLNYEAGRRCRQGSRGDVGSVMSVMMVASDECLVSLLP